MDFKRRINAFRRNLMNRITRNVGTSNADIKDKSEIKHVLICRPNHRLGNLVLTTPLVQEVIVTFPDCKIDLLVKGNLAKAVFKNYKNIDQFIQLPKKPFKNIIGYIQVWLSIRKNNYDLVINVVKGSSSGRLLTNFAKAKYKFFGDDIAGIESRYPDYHHMAKQPVYYFRYCLSKIGVEERLRPVPLLDIKLNVNELAEGKKKLEQLVDYNRKTIGLFTYATGDKCYSESWWETFYQRLKSTFPEYNFIEILSVENISMLSRQVPTYAHKDIRNVGAVIANTSVFIAADGGVMHLAGSVHVPTVGLFSMTDPKSYEPYNAGSVGINTNNTTLEDWIKIIAHILTSGGNQDRESHN
jgi:ADP-heptose:LPS heptosyltransferase